MIIHTRQAWWCDVINEPFMPAGLKTTAADAQYNCTQCGSKVFRYEDDWPMHRLILMQIPKDPP